MSHNPARLAFGLVAALLLTTQAQAASESWTLTRTDTYAYFDAKNTGIYRTQGVAFDSTQWLFSWQYGLERTDLNFNSLQRTGSISLGASGISVNTGIPKVLADQGFDHIGDIDVHNGILYASLDSEAGDYNNGHVALFNARDLSYTGKLFPLIGAPSNPRDDVASWVAVDGANGLGYGKEWKNGNTINVYNLADWSFSHTLTMDQSISKIQGAKVFNGAMYLSSHNADKSVYKLDLSSGHVEELFRLPKAPNAFNETEGIALRALEGGGAEMLVEMIVEPNGNRLGSELKVFHYTLSPVPEPSSYALLLAGLGMVAATARRRTAKR
jgi:hypothetical protein